MTLRCQNCGTDQENPECRSYDLDLPVVVLCDPCSLWIWLDPVEFERAGARYRLRPDEAKGAASGTQ